MARASDGPASSADLGWRAQVLWCWTNVNTKGASAPDTIGVDVLLVTFPERPGRTHLLNAGLNRVRQTASVVVVHEFARRRRRRARTDRRRRRLRGSANRGAPMVRPPRRG